MTSLIRTESAIAANRETTLVVNSYTPRSSREERVPDDLLISNRHESHQLKQKSFHWFQDTDIFQSDHLSETEIHPTSRIIQIRMRGIYHQIIFTGLDHTTLNISLSRQ